jgi:ABC-type antimicrobial peptide transport system permease subunit
MTTLAEDDRASRAFLLQVVGGAAAGGALALLLSSIGLYATMSLAVTQRTREIGIRTALGAAQSHLLGRYVAGGVRLGAIGIACGLPLSLVALRLIGRQIWVAAPSALLLGAIIGGLVVAVSALASFAPANRATRVAPTVALRGQ